MRALLLLLSTALAYPGSAQEQADAQGSIVPQEQPGEIQTVIITGTPIHESESRLAACLARKCPPKEDIHASLGHAENQFVAGDYAGARRTLYYAPARNKRFAATLPTEVADLLRAHGRMTNLDGRVDLGRLSQIESLDALRAGFGETDSRVLIQRLMIGDEYARANRLRAAEGVYKSVARKARAVGQWNVVGAAMLRDAVAHGAVASAVPQYRYIARSKLAKLEKSREPELAPYRAAGRLLRAQLAALDKDQGPLEEAIAAIPPGSPQNPVLVYAPPIIDPQSEPTLTILSVAGSGTPEWIDVSFRIAANGTVYDVERVRGSDNMSGAWPKLVTGSVGKRRYAPLALPAGSDGPRRVERFSYIHDQAYATGSRIAGRSYSGRITSLDITADASRS